MRSNGILILLLNIHVDTWDEAVKFFKKETMNTPHEKKEEEIMGYDNAINPVQPWEDSYLFIRKGWAGR